MPMPVPIHLHAADIDVVDPCREEPREVPGRRLAAQKMVAAAALHVERPGPRVAHTALRQNPAFNGCESPQKRERNAGAARSSDDCALATRRFGRGLPGIDGSSAGQLRPDRAGEHDRS
jgi:hypothetical protein